MITTHTLPDEMAHIAFDVARYMRQRMLQKACGPTHIAQVHALLAIQSHPGMTMKELATTMHITSPSATTFVDRLVRLGHVKRLSDAMNRKLVRLHVTEKGQIALQEAMAERRKVLAEILSALSPSELLSLKSIMKKILTRSHH